jgi:2-polyprenyl-3-methyl-5-hydroxy-6-metoxy-1,4-benzoquinol methylase
LEFPAFRAFRRITSDCRPWPAGGRLCGCPSCGSVQKIVDDAWNREVAELYAGYAIYDQAAGAEQAVFDQATGAAMSRSTRLLAALRGEVELPVTGRMLDVGCGNGAMLRAFSQAMPGWSLAGTELGDKYRGTIESIAGVERLYTCQPWEVPGEFDAISMIHVLEHIPHPEAYLKQLVTKLRPGGMLIVELPHHVANPFELLIADHCTHFAADTAATLLQRAGFDVLQTAEDWVPKELTLVARRPLWSAGACSRFSSSDDMRTDSSAAVGPVGGADVLKSGGKPSHSKDCVAARLEWLAEISAAARELATKRNIGLFGTSIAGTWLFAELEGRAGFFVDEDPHRIGTRWHDRLVYHPREIPAGSSVVVPLPRPLAENIARRIARPDFELCLPSSLV